MKTVRETLLTFFTTSAFIVLYAGLLGSAAGRLTTTWGELKTER